MLKRTMYKGGGQNKIDYHHIDYLIKCNIPELADDRIKIKGISMQLFEEAMIHPTIQKSEKNYERLEYLGDAVFHLIITEYLFHRFPKENEGFMTRLRIKIERGESMSELTTMMGLEHFIQCNKKMTDDVLEDVFEAFIGAFYLNFGMGYTYTFVINLIEKYKNISEIIDNDDNFKDLLLRFFHQKQWGHPIYRNSIKMIELKGSKSMKKQKFYFSTVNDNKGNTLGTGKATSKRKAEQSASRKALVKLGVIVNNVVDNDWINKIEKISKDDKNTGDASTLVIFNPQNKLIKKKDIDDIFQMYHLVPPKIKYNIKPFQEAMTHRSYLIRKKITKEEKEKYKKCVKPQKKSNERIRFLGDAVIHFIIGEHLYLKYPEKDEGFLTRMRCKLENKNFLYYLSKETCVIEYILISQSIEVIHGRTNLNIMSKGFEAFIGALYLEFGLNTVHMFFMQVFKYDINLNEVEESETNYKDTILQKYHANKWGTPIYKIVKEDGPDHSKLFTMGIYLKGELMGVGRAPSKKEAEQLASKEMLDKIK